MTDELKPPEPPEVPDIPPVTADDPPKEAEKRHEISREEACRRIGCSTMQVQRWEIAGEIRVRRDDAGGKKRPRVWLSSEDVDRVARSWVPRRQTTREKVDSNVVASNARGRLAALCFPLFQERCTGDRYDQRAAFTRIVAETGGDPALVRELYEEWCLSLDGGIQLKREKERKARAATLQKESVRRDEWADYRAWKRKQAELERENLKMRLEAARLEAEAKAVRDKDSS